MSILDTFLRSAQNAKRMSDWHKVTDGTDIRKIHFVGIKGVAMAGLAVICKERGFDVAGSDVPSSFITDKVLEKAGIKVFSSFSSENLSWGPDLVVVGASWDESNEEVDGAVKKQIPMVTESDLRGGISEEKKTIAVTGVHGKTTTTSLLAYIFSLAKKDPSYLIGTALIPDLGVNGHWSRGEHFIVEGDEYVKSRKNKTPKFLDLSPKTSIITSIEWEHVDVYENLSALERAYDALVKKTDGPVIACRDWKSTASYKEQYGDKVITYGENLESDWVLTNYDQKLHYSTFSVIKNKRIFDDFELRLIGRFNALNALACLVVADYYEIPLSTVREAFRTFSGLERRMEVEHRKDIIFIDDYAHHPTAVKNALHAIRNTYERRRIVCVFQPHMASRTKAFFHEFSRCFTDADVVVLVDIFASAREKDVDVSTQDLFREIQRYHADVHYFGGIEDTTEGLRSIIKPRDIVVTMGAGDVYKIRDAF